MNKIHVILVVLLAVTIAIVSVWVFSHTGKSVPEMVIGGQTFKLIIAKEKRERQIGLSGRESLSEDFGMLFLFERPGYYSFYMRDMKFPIDIIFINDNKIVTIYKNLRPPLSPSEHLISYVPKEQADRVLEINSGLSDKYGFREGMEVKYNLCSRGRCKNE